MPNNIIGIRTEIKLLTEIMQISIMNRIYSNHSLFDKIFKQTLQPEYS